MNDSLYRKSSQFGDGVVFWCMRGRLKFFWRTKVAFGRLRYVLTEAEGFPFFRQD